MKLGALKFSAIYITACIVWAILSRAIIVFTQDKFIPAASGHLYTIMLFLFVLMNVVIIYKLVKLNNKTAPQEENDFLALYLSNPNPLWIYDPETLKFVWVNEAAIAAYGYSREAFLSMTINDIRKKGDHEKEVQPIHNLVDISPVTGSSFTSGIWEHQKKDGSVIYVNITSHKIMFGQQDCVLLLALDATDRVEHELELKLTNQRLHEEKQKLNQTERLAKVSGWEYFVEDGSLIWSDELYEIFDFDREKDKVNYSRLLKTVHREDLTAYNTAIENLLRHGKRLNLVYRFVAKAGNIKYVKVLGDMHYKDGKMFKAQGTMQDITELHLMQMEKNIYLQRLNHTLENITDGYFLLNRNWIITAVNLNCVKLIGSKKEDLINRPYLDVFPESRDLKFYTSYNKVFDEHIPVNFEEYNPVIKKWFSVNAYPTDDGVAVYFNDISESKQKDLQLKQALERYDLIAKATKDVIYDWDVINNKIDYNHNISELLGMEFEEAHCSNLQWWKDRVHPDDLNLVLRSHKKAIRKKVANCVVEYRMKTNAGIYKYVYDQGYLQYNNNEKFVRMTGALKDIDQLKRVDDENKRLADIITKVNNMIMIFDVNDKISWVNKAFEKFTGYTLNEVSGKSAYEILNGPETDLLTAADIVSGKKGFKSFSCEVICYTKQRKQYWANVEFTPLFTMEGKPDGYISIQTDITPQKERAERTSRQNEILTNIAWMSSHELRRPVASILGLIELINESTEQTEKEESIRLMYTCTKQLDEIVHKINRRIEQEIAED